MPALYYAEPPLDKIVHRYLELGMFYDAVMVLEEIAPEDKNPHRGPGLLRARAIHSKVGMIAFNPACYASVTGRMEEAKELLRRAIDLDKDVRKLALDNEDLKPLSYHCHGR